jgi:protein SCO1/2
VSPRFTRTAATIAIALLPACGYAQYADPPPRPTSVTAKPGLLKSIAIDQKIGEQLPLNLTFKDEHGTDVRLGQYFGGSKPVVMALAYFECPMLCTQVLNGMTGALKTISFEAGKDYEVVVVSIDPRDTPELAAEKKINYLKSYGRPNSAAGFHFLTGTNDSIKPLAASIGFHYAYDETLGQFAHGAAIYVATPKGIISRYLLGIDFAPRDLRLAMVEASENKLGTVRDQVLLLCYHYDPTEGKYGAAILNAIRAGFILTVGAFLTFLFVSHRRETAAAQTGTRT